LAESNPRAKDEVVSFDSESLVLVDSNDAVVGYQDKATCHDGEGMLHRAFSLFIFDRDGQLLLQQRSAGKRLWPLYWSNSCCSHPRKGETLEVATQRRLQQELGLRAELEYLYRFQYQVPYRDLGSEHELCSVLIGHSDAEPVVNANEIAAWRYISPADLDYELDTRAEEFMPWFKMEWARIRKEFPEALRAA